MFDLLKEKRSSLHLEVLNCSLFSVNQVWTPYTALCMVVALSLQSISDIEVSSMYFQLLISTFETLRLFIIKINNQGPNFVPWGIPEGAPAHSEKQS